MSLLTSRDWELYERRCGREHVEWLRSLAASQAFSLFEDLHRFAASLKVDAEGRERLERSRWEGKLARRRRWVEALMQWDRARGGGRDSTDAQ